MMNNIISLVKEKVGGIIGGDADVPQEKKSEVIETTATSIIDSLKRYITPDNIASLTSLLGQRGANNADSAGIQNHEITQGVQSNLVSSLISKTGINQSTANKIASNVVPAIMAMFSKKANDSNDSGFNIGSLVGAFTGSSSTKGTSGEGILEKVGSFFKK